MRRRGVTLAELAIAVTIGLLVTGVCQSLMMRAERLFDSTRRQIDLGVGVRALVETLVKDVASAQQVMPGREDLTDLVLVRAADAEVRERLRANPSWAFPFPESTGQTVQKAPLLRVTYAYDAARRVIVRREEPGVLEATADGRSTARLARFEFRPAGASERVICESVVSVAFRALGMNEERRLVSLRPAEPDAPGIENASVIVMQLEARYEEGVYAAPGRQVPQVAMCVPFHSIKRRSDGVHAESFSSTDEDLSW